MQRFDRELSDHNRLASTGVPLKEPLPTKQVVPPDQLFLPTLRHGAVGFEALGVLIQYLVYDLDAFATPDLKKQVEKMKVEYNNTKCSLEELQLKNRRLEETLSQEKTSYQQKILLVETKHSQEIAELVSHHEEQLADYEKKLQLQVDEMKGRYEGELCRLDRLNSERVEALLEDGQARLEQANAERGKEMERLQVETLRREAELQRRLTGADTELAGLKEQARRFVDGLQQDRDSKLQATAGHCRELQDEVESLHTVLDLRREEIAELRRQNLELARDAGELPQVLQKNAALLARVEDLQVQLQRKSNFERQLSRENKLLMESYHQETSQKKRLSLHNEELQWKLKQNAEVVNAFAALAGTPISIPLLTVTNGNRKSSDAEYFDSSFNNLFSRSFNPHKENHSGVSGNSPPASPKVKAVVEKGDSVSWVLEMDDAPEEIFSRLVRRAGSFRGTTPPPPVSSPAHSRTLPRRPRSKTSSLTLSASAGAIGHGHGRAVRPRSVSTDSVEVDYHSWSEVPNCSTPVSQLEQSHLPLDEELLIHVSNKVSLKRSGDAEDDVKIHQSTNGLAAKRPNAETTLEELQEKSSSMSNSSVSSSCSDGSVNSSGCGSEREYHHRLNGSKNLSDDVLDLDEAEILPLPPLPGSTSDLSLLAACAAAQPSLVPKDSAGEAMISEETSEDENEHEVVNSSDEQSCSDEEDSSSECSSGLGCESSRGLTHEDGPKSNFDEVLEGTDQRVLSDHTSKQQYNLLIMSDSTTTTTTMDISWSEDIELMPSETEG